MRRYLGWLLLGATLSLLGGLRPAASGQQPPQQPQPRAGGAGRTLHVWKESPAPTAPYPTKLLAARRVEEALALAGPGDTVLVHGDCVKAGGRCTYQENLTVACGVALRGDGTLPAIPILAGDGGRVITGAGNRCPPEELTSVSFFEIQNGQTSGRGGAIFFPNRRARIDNNCCHDNQAGIGGCIAIRLDDNSLPRPVVVIEDNLIERNRATRSGGAVSIEGTYLNPGRIEDWHAELNGNTIRENEVQAATQVAWGGALEVFRARVRARGNLFERNTVLGEVESYGGHVAVMNQDENVLFRPGWALFDRGAAGWSRDVSQLEPEQYFSEANIYRLGGRKGAETLRGGGAVAALWNASVRVRGDWVYENQANTGGALYVNARSLLEVDSSHLENNVAQGDGGAAYVVCGSRVRLPGGNLVENNQAHGRNPVGGPRHAGSPTPYPRGGGGFYVRNSQAELRRTNVIRKNQARALFAQTAGYGGGLFLWQVDKALLFPGHGPRDQLEGLICNRTTRLTVEGANLFEENTAQHEGGGLAILLEADDPAAFQRLAGGLLRLERSFARSYLVEGTQLRNNRVWPDPRTGALGAGGLYYHEHFAPDAGAQPADSKWAQGTTLVRGVLVESNEGWGLKVVHTGMQLRSADGRLQWVQPTLELEDSLIQANSAGGLHLRGSWPRVVGNHFVGNMDKQVEIDNDRYTRPHLPVFTENHLDGFRRSRVGIYVVNAPGDASPGWSNRLETNNLIDHSEHAAELATTYNALLMPQNWWGPSGPVPAGSNPPAPPNSVRGYVLTHPPLTAPVDVPLEEFPRITVNPPHPTEPPIPPCPGIVPVPGVPTEPPGIPPQPPRRPPDEPPGRPPEPTPGQPPVPKPGEPVPTRGHPPRPGEQPTPPPGELVPTPGHPPQPEPEPGWTFSVPADQVVGSTLSAKNFCRRRHRFQVSVEDLPFLRLLDKASFQVSPGQAHTVPVEINTAGLAPGEYRGTVIIQCQTCNREPTCTQDRSVLPVRMTVLPAAAPR